MIDVEEIKAHLGIEPTDETYDDALAELEIEVVAEVERLTGWYFRHPEETTVIVTAFHRDRLWLPAPLNIPAGTAVVSVSEQQYAGGTVTALAVTTDYEVRTSETQTYLVRTAGAHWTPGYEYAVTYRQGWAPGLEPPDIRKLVKARVARAWLAGDEGLRSETISGYSYTKGTEDDEVLKRENEIIAVWRNNKPVLA